MDYFYISDRGVVDYQLLERITSEHFVSYVERFSSGKVDYIKVLKSDDTPNVIFYVKLSHPDKFIRFIYAGSDDGHYLMDNFDTIDLLAFGLKVVQ